MCKHFNSHAAIRIHLSKMMKNPQKGQMLKVALYHTSLRDGKSTFHSRKRGEKRKRLLQVIYLYIQHHLNKVQKNFTRNHVKSINVGVWWMQFFTLRCISTNSIAFLNFPLQEFAVFPRELE